MNLYVALQAAVRLHIALHAESLLGPCCKTSHTLPARTLSTLQDKDAFIHAFVHSIISTFSHLLTDSLTHSLTCSITFSFIKFISSSLGSAHMSAAGTCQAAATWLKQACLEMTGGLCTALQGKNFHGLC